jgi:hypothetical protein
LPWPRKSPGKIPPGLFSVEEGLSGLENLYSHPLRLKLEGYSGKKTGFIRPASGVSSSKNIQLESLTYKSTCQHI